MGSTSDKRIQNSKFVFYFILLIFFTNSPADTEPKQSETIEDQIALCKSLEDDKPKQAIELANSLISQLDESKGRVNYGQVLGCLAWSYAVDNQSEKATALATSIEVMANKLETGEDKIGLLRRAGGVFHRTGNRIAAVDNYQQAMGLAESLNLKHQQIPVLINLGVLNSQIREHTDAINNYYLALQLINETESFKYKPPVLFNLAVTLNGQKRYQESLKIYHQVEAMISEQWPATRAAQVYTGLASAYFEEGKLKQGKTYIDKALLLLEQDNNKSVDLYGAKIMHAKILTALGLKALAMEQAKQAWEYFKLPKNREQLLSINNPLYGLADVYEQNKDPVLSLTIHKLARTVSQEFQDSFNKETMSQMQARLSDSQQRNELTELKTENAMNQLKLNQTKHNKERMMIVMGFCAVVFLSYLFWQKRSNNHLRQISMRDSLTKLGNRRAVKHWISSQRFPEDGKVRLLWLIDLDLFKHINDEFGHETGDEVLIKVSELLRSHGGADRFVGRWGGEEFMLITDDLVEKEARVFGDKLLKSIECMVLNCKGSVIKLTASMGVSQISDEDKSSWNDALSLADKRLYSAKNQGRNKMVFFNDSEINSEG